MLKASGIAVKRLGGLNRYETNLLILQEAKPTETEYIVYQYDEAGILYAEDRPRMILCRLMVHLFLPTGQNPRSLKRRIREALHDAGGTWPAVINANDREGQHYIFECEMLEGNGPDG